MKTQIQKWENSLAWPVPRVFSLHFISLRLCVNRFIFRKNKMVMFTTPNGNELLAFYPGNEPVRPADDAPLTWVMMIAKHRGHYLLLYNPQREQWENPGGGIQAGEHPDETAHRELMEETSQIASSLVCKAVFKMRFQPDLRIEYAVLYAVEVAEIREHTPNEEAEKIALYDSLDDPPGIVSAISRKMIELCDGL